MEQLDRAPHRVGVERAGPADAPRSARGAPRPRRAPSMRTEATDGLRRGGARPASAERERERGAASRDWRRRRSNPRPPGVGPGEQQREAVGEACTPRTIRCSSAAAQVLGVEDVQVGGDALAHGEARRRVACPRRARHRGVDGEAVEAERGSAPRSRPELLGEAARRRGWRRPWRPARCAVAQLRTCQLAPRSRRRPARRAGSAPVESGGSEVRVGVTRSSVPFTSG